MERHLEIIRKFNLKVGDRVITPKSLFDIVQHHAIFLGNIGREFWFIENKEGIGVRLITARDFFVGVETITQIIRFQPTWNYSRESLTQKAYDLIGKRYEIWDYNCESFANDLQHCKPASEQAEFAKAILFFLGFVLFVRALSN